MTWWRWRFILGKWLEFPASVLGALGTCNGSFLFWALILESWVKTNMGQGFANAVGVETPPMELDVCVKGLLEQVSSRCVVDM